MSLSLKVHELEIRYDSAPVLEGLEFSIEQGELVALLGHNGAGKSTLLRCIGGSLQPDQGAILLDGKDASRFSALEIARLLAVVPQDTGVDFDFTVEEVVRMGRYPYLRRFQKEGANDDQIVTAAMEKTGILALRYRSAASLSGGERQRMIFARALCQEPKLLLLDEPTANLDIGYQWELLKTAGMLNREQGMTIIAAIHDLNLATLFFRKFILLAGGQISAIGSAEEVLTEENIRNSYGVSATVFRHPLHGRLQVSLTEKGADLAKEKDNTLSHEARIHVIGGGKEAIPLLELLRDRGYSLSIGPVSREDTCYQFARYFGLPVIEVQPFADISEANLLEHRKLMK